MANEVEEIRATCLLNKKSGEPCKLSVQIDQFNKHLRDKHKIQMPENQKLRVFFSKDSGKTWSIVFLNKKVKDRSYPDLESGAKVKKLTC